MSHVIDDPVDAAPFLAWVDRRLERIGRELNALPAVQGIDHETNPTQRLMGDIGWTADSGARRR